MDRGISLPIAPLVNGCIVVPTSTLNEELNRTPLLPSRTRACLFISVCTANGQTQDTHGIEFALPADWYSHREARPRPALVARPRLQGGAFS